MPNNFYNFIAPVVAGSTIRSDKYNTDHQAIDSGFEATELELGKRLRLPDTFTGNAVIPEVNAADSFLYIDGNQNITLYSAALFQSQFNEVSTKYNQINTWQGEVSTNTSAVASNLATTAANVTTTTTQAGLAVDARDLAQEWASNASNVVVTGTSAYSAMHWAIKAQEYANQTLATVSGDFVPSWRTVNSKPLSADIVLQAADVFAVPTTRTINGKALSADVIINVADISTLQTSLDNLDSSINRARRLALAGI